MNYTIKEIEEFKNMTLHGPIPTETFYAVVEDLLELNKEFLKECPDRDPVIKAKMDEYKNLVKYKDTRTPEETERVRNLARELEDILPDVCAGCTMEQNESDTIIRLRSFNKLLMDVVYGKEPPERLIEFSEA